MAKFCQWDILMDGHTIRHIAEQAGSISLKPEPPVMRAGSSRSASENHTPKEFSA